MQSLTLGPFAVHSSGALVARDAALRPSLRFAWRGRPCQAELGPAEMRIAAIAARIPSTADPESDRPAALAALAALSPRMPDGWRLRLLPDHRISLETEAPLSEPPTAVTLVTAMVRFALALDPYLETLEAAGAEAPGRAKTWPG